ncbi:MogA/MoaB family molybdenum cofactor biosynthesis protein [Microlunatus speluncae]|uniref:MogA/MoaB family molybdenum cofactor biosynthesis protein n=1 Tax=Microlunatus speluncae TaxID=2594267 RepID=UPI0012663574|nr:MogA/MoaB family molybdenum cofactor biosynthesis protein [Microlunatus speluncae]
MTDEARPTAAVVTVSTRAAAGDYADRSGPIIAESLRELEFEVTGPYVVADGLPVGEILRELVFQAAVDVVITTGGTGINPTDQTPEQTRGLLTAELPQLAAAIARYGVDHGVPTAVLSRGLAGVASRTLIINLPGSSGGARDGMAVLKEVLPHAVSQLRGSDHRAGDQRTSEQRGSDAGAGDG